MINRIFPALIAVSMLGVFPTYGETFHADAEFRVAFANDVRPRGIELFSNDDAEDVEGAGSDGPDDEVDAPNAPVTFTEPFIGVDEAINNQSIADLILGTPLFSPIEGLPEAVWKDKSCTDCHGWTQETLCDQGGFYVKQGFKAVDRKEHPYGGAFKQEVMRWADRGCE